MDTPTAGKVHHQEVVHLGREEVAPPHASRGIDAPKANEVHHEEVVQLNPKGIPRHPTRFTTKRSYSLVAKR